MFQLQPLPFAENKLEPYISANTIHFHYNAHHLNYVNKTNLLVQETPFKNLSLTELILSTGANSLYRNLFNQAAQVYNHNFYWQSLTPQQMIIPSELEDLMIRYFKTLDDFKSEFLSQGLSVFGSSWVWLIRDSMGALKIITTPNGETPITQSDVKPLLCLDVWEHAYYLDYQNKRNDYLKNCIDHLLNWRFAWDNYRIKP